MSTLGPLLFVLLLAVLAMAGLTGVGVQDTRDTRYTLACTSTRLAERARVPEPLAGQRTGRLGRIALPALASRHLHP
jgi:hypothetical protein